MPISYEPPAPVGAAVGLARLEAGGGVSVAQQYAAEMQARQQSGALQAQLMAQDRGRRDDALERRDEFAASRTFSPRDAGLAQAQMAEIGQRAQAQAWLNGQELSQAENIRLQRLKQGEDQIKQQMGEGTVTNDEGLLMIQQLRTPMELLERRKALTQIKHQEMQNDQIKNQIEVASAAERRKVKDAEDHLQYSAAATEGKLKHVVDPAAARALTSEYRRQFPDLSDEDIAKSVEEELMTQGKYTTWYPDSKGVPTLAKDVHSHGGWGTPGQGEGGQQAGGQGSSGSRARGGQAPVFDPSRAYHDAESAVDKLVTGGTLKPEDAAAEIEKRFQARLRAVEGYQGAQGEKAKATQAAPFDHNNLATGTPQQQAQVVRVKDLFGTLRARQAEFTPNQQFVMSQAINESVRLLSQYSDPSGTLAHAPPIVKRRLEHIEALLRPLTRTGATPAAAPAGETRGQLAERLSKRASEGVITDRAEAEAVNAPPAPPNGVPLPPQDVIDPSTGRKITLPGTYGIRPAGG